MCDLLAALSFHAIEVLEEVEESGGVVLVPAAVRLRLVVFGHAVQCKPGLRAAWCPPHSRTAAEPGRSVS